MKKSKFIPKMVLKDNNIIASNDNTKRNIVGLREEVKKQFPFLAGIIDNVTIQDKGSATPGSLGATDGKSIAVNADRITTSKKKGIFVLAHEAYHIKRGDVQKFAGRNHKIANIVTDAIINEELREQGGEFNDGVNIPSAKHYGEEALYKLIEETLYYIAADNMFSASPEFTEQDLWEAVLGDRSKWERIVRYHDEKQRELNDPKKEEDEREDEPDENEKDEYAQDKYGQQEYPGQNSGNIRSSHGQISHARNNIRNFPEQRNAGQERNAESGMTA